MVSCKAAQDSVSFQNFSDNVVLDKVSGDTFLVNGSTLQVKLSNRIIVKSKSLDRSGLAVLYPGIASVISLFESEQGHYYQLTIGSINDLPSVIRHLSNVPEIDLVQPDILQLHTKAEQPRNKIPPAMEPLNTIIPKHWEVTRGAGVKVAVIDDGFDLNHEDLRGLQTSFSYDLHERILEAPPAATIDTHGTKITGVIFAEHNDFGINGIAPQAELIALRHVDTWTSKTLISFHLARLAGADIVNASWHSQWLLEPIADAVTELAEYGRGKKGIAVVFAAGNQGKEILPLSTEAAIDSAIVVGGLNRHRQKLPASNHGDSVDMFVYGGGLQTTTPGNQYGNFAGTSLSAAIISGTAALLLSENPDLTLQQLKKKLLAQNGIERVPPERREETN